MCCRLGVVRNVLSGISEMYVSGAMLAFPAPLGVSLHEGRSKDPRSRAIGNPLLTMQARSGDGRGREGHRMPKLIVSAVLA